MSTKRNHDRAADKTGFSVALPKKLVAELEDIAKKETRTRNGQIEHFLSESVARYWAEKSAAGKGEGQLQSLVHQTVALLEKRAAAQPPTPRTDPRSATPGQG